MKAKHINDGRILPSLKTTCNVCFQVEDQMKAALNDFLNNSQT